MRSTGRFASSGWMRLVAVGLLAGVFAAGCGSSTCSTCPPTTTQPCDIPAHAATAAIAIHSGRTSYAVNDTFWVSVVLHNVDATFGASVEVTYPSNLVDVLRISGCSNGFSQGQNLAVGKIDAASNRVSFGVTRLRGSTPVPAGNTVLFYMGCRAKGTGSVPFQVVAWNLKLLKSDGSPIDSMATLRQENLSVTVH